MKRTASPILLAILFASLPMSLPSVWAVDTDGDGLLDLLDVPGFDPSQPNSWFFFQNAGIEDLDGANQLTNATELRLENNQITSLERGDFQGLSNLRSLDLSRNVITTIQNDAFREQTNLWDLWLFDNATTSRSTPHFLNCSPTSYEHSRRSRATG